MHLEERPVVLLSVADAGFAARAVQAATLHLGCHLPTERLTLGHGRHHRAHPFGGRGPPPLFLATLLGWRRLRTPQRRPLRFLPPAANWATRAASKNLLGGSG